MSASWWMILALAQAAQATPAPQERPSSSPLEEKAILTVRDAIKALARNPPGKPDPATPVPIGSPARWFSADDYPVAARRAGEQGRVVATLDIDQAGRVSGCNVTQSSGSTSLDEATCRIALAKMTFTPAHDRSGHALASIYRLPIAWRLPDNSAAMAAIAASMVTTLVSVGEDGAILSCTSQSAAPMPDLCAAFPKGQKLPGLDTMKGKVVVLATFMRPLAE